MREHSRIRTVLRRVLWAALAIVVLLCIGVGALRIMADEAIGAAASGERHARMERSPQWADGVFQNRLKPVNGPFVETMRKFLFGGSDYRTPNAPVPTVRRSAADYQTPPKSGLRITWLGHSTLLLEIDGQRVLIDPVWGERASPFTFVGPKRFFAPLLDLADLPQIDAVVISHDHYDHLDMPTVKALLASGVRWIVPLGVGAHLNAWDVPETDITELDWWEDVQLGGLTITATPARHFGGRGLTDAGRTLWSGWAIAGSAHRVFYSGDTGMHNEFAEIGRRLGPFDLTMIEAGAYDALWADLHLGPEQAVQAHQLVRGDVMLPVHWGLFDLAMHGWTEPIERTQRAAEAAGVRIATPRPGDMFEPATLGMQLRWWPTLPWEKASVAPVRSSGLKGLTN